MFTGEENQNGSITLIALVTLVLLTIMGISVSMVTTTDIRIYGNEKSFKESFYIAEGAQNREAQELGNGSYPLPLPIQKEPEPPKPFVDNVKNTGAPFPHIPHEVNGEKYNFNVTYTGYDELIPQKGYGVLAGHVAFNFDISSWAAPKDEGGSIPPPRKIGVTITSRYHRIGPKPE